MGRVLGPPDLIQCYWMLLTAASIELTGASDKIDQFCALMEPLGLVEVSRTGVLSIKRGAEKG